MTESKRGKGCAPALSCFFFVAHYPRRRREIILLCIANSVRVVVSPPPSQSMFRDPGECHSLKIPQRGHNQWLRRANRTSATASSSSSSSPAPSSPSPGSSLPRPPSAESLGAGRPLEEESDGSHLRLPPWADGGSGSDAAGHDGSYPVTPPNTVASAWATTSPVGKAGGAAEGACVCGPDVHDGRVKYDGENVVACLFHKVALLRGMKPSPTCCVYLR